jgi:hypothetical protein
MTIRVTGLAIVATALQVGCKCDCESTFTILFDTPLNAYTADLIVDEEPLSFTFADDTATVTDGSVTLVTADGTGFGIAGEAVSIEATVVASDPTWNASAVWSPTWNEGEADKCGCIYAQASLAADE